MIRRKPKQRRVHRQNLLRVLIPKGVTETAAEWGIATSVLSRAIAGERLYEPERKLIESKLHLPLEVLQRPITELWAELLVAAKSAGLEQ